MACPENELSSRALREGFGGPGFFVDAKFGEGNRRLRLRIWIAAVVCLFWASGARRKSGNGSGRKAGWLCHWVAARTEPSTPEPPMGMCLPARMAGRHWELRGRVGTRTDAVISRLVSEPGASGRLFAAVWYQEAGAGEEYFTARTGDVPGGSRGLQTEAVRALEIAPGNSKELVAGTLSGVFRSDDAGQELGADFSGGR